MQTLNNRVIIVLGMHRSGTSALTRVLNLHGMELGSRMIGPGADNETGFWEHQDIVGIHDKILKALHSSWEDETLPDQWWLKKSFRWHLKKLTQILARDFSQCRLWGIKDPRMCRLLPLWLPLLEKLNCRPVFVLVLRHPQEVAKSLEKRNGFSLQKGERLWFQHSLLLERSTRGFPRTIILYEQLLSDWKEVMNQVQSVLKSPWPRIPAEGEVEQFLNPTMRHHKAPEHSNLSAWTRQTYEAFLHGFMGNQEVMMKNLDLVYSGYEVMQSFVGDLQSQLESARVLNRQLSDKLQAVQKQRGGMAFRGAKFHLTGQKGYGRAVVVDSAVQRWLNQGRSLFKRVFDRGCAPGGHQSVVPRLKNEQTVAVKSARTAS